LDLVVEDPSGYFKHLSDWLGSLVAVFLLRDTWPRRVVLFVAGALAAYYGAPYVASHAGADRELAGFLTGLFSMAVTAKVFEAVESLQPKDLVDRVLRRLGL
jgi:hypothetical protein